MTPDGVDAIINAAGAAGVGIGPALREAKRSDVHHTWCAMFEGYSDEQVLGAARAWFALRQPGEWLDAGAIRAHLQRPQDETSRATAAEAAAIVLRARALRWSTDPLAPDEPDVTPLPAGPRVVECRFTRRRCVQLDADGAPVMLPERRPDGRWRVAGDPVRVTHAALERFVWGLLRDLGGVEPLREAARGEDVAWRVWLASWRRNWEVAGRGGRSPSLVEVRSGLALPPPPVAPVGLQIVDRGEVRDRSADLRKLGVVVGERR